MAIIAVFLEGAALVALFVLYLACFNVASPVHGPYEVFAQDSTHILDNLALGKPYAWNPQSHLLYHVVVERGFAVWKGFYGGDIESAFRYLKALTALCGLGFLAGMTWFFREIGMGPGRRALLLVLTGLTISAWFHFAGFETYSIAMPGFALYLVALARLRRPGSRGLPDHLLLVGSLLLCGWTRFDLFRLAAVTALFLWLPALRRHRAGLALDLVLVLLLGALGTAGLARVQLGLPFSKGITAPFARTDREGLNDDLRTVKNLTPASLGIVGRAVTLYTVLMPIERPPAERSFWAPPSYHLSLQYEGDGTLPATDLFMEPPRHLLRTAISSVALLGVLMLFLWGAVRSLRRAAAGDPLHVLLIAQAVSGWLLYTWFNPHEPFLWGIGFLPLWAAGVADHVWNRGAVLWIGLGLLTLAVGLHNAFAFYVPFR